MYVPLHCLIYIVGEGYQRIAVSSSESSKSLMVNVQKNCVVFCNHKYDGENDFFLPRNCVRDYEYKYDKLYSVAKAIINIEFIPSRFRVILFV